MFKTCQKRAHVDFKLAKVCKKELKTETYAPYLVYKDPSGAWHAKAFAAVVAAYAFNPIDLTCDPIPILGYLDDLILVPLGIALAIKMIPPGVMSECRERARLKTAEKKPKNWITALIIVIIWLALAYLVVRFMYWVVRG